MVRVRKYMNNIKKIELINHIEKSIGFVLVEMRELEDKIKHDKETNGISVKDLADYQRYASCFEMLSNGFDKLIKAGDADWL